MDLRVNSTLGEEGQRKLMTALFLGPQYNQDTGKFGFKCELPQENYPCAMAQV